MVGFMPRAMRMDRMQGEHGVGQDSAAERQEFERQMERGRLEAIDEEALKPRRRGWQESELTTRRRSDPGKLTSAARAGFPERCLCPPDSSSQFVEMVLQLNGGEPAFQIRQTARPIEFEAALRGAPGFCRSRLRQELDECLHLLLRQDGQSFIFGDQCVSAHNKSCYPQPAGVAIRHLDDSSGFNSPLSAIRPPISDFSFPNFGISVWPSRL
jgi:hypothetical protein